VLRSIGAQSQTIYQLVMVEGGLLGLASWAIGAMAAIPLTWLLDDRLGTRLLSMPTVYQYSPEGLGLWLLGALVLGGLASWLPARNAVRLTVRDTLAYE
jgi:putative ABC transport system permease protein